MVADLESVFGDTADAVPSQEDGDYEFSPATLPSSPAQLETASVIVTKATHGYHSYTINEVDALWFQANKRTYKLLGLLFLSKVFHADPRDIELRLTHPQSQVRKLVLDYDQQSPWQIVPHYTTTPSRFWYAPQPLRRIPLSDTGLNDRFLPLFALTNEAHMIGPTDEAWKNRDVVRCAGSDVGNVLFGEVLLNLSRPEELLVEVALESELGFGGVGPGSAEIRLYLPGSFGWSGELPE